MVHNTDSKKWYAIRVTYSRELIVKSYLDKYGIESFIPMRTETRTVGGVERERRVPAIHNLIFIHISPADLREIKTCTLLPIRYIMDRQTRLPTVIPEKQMQDFIAVATARNERVEIVEAESIDLAQGDRVRVKEGIFAGIEGIYIRHKGHSKVAVSICGIAAALTAYVPLRSVEKLN